MGLFSDIYNGLSGKTHRENIENLHAMNHMSLIDFNITFIHKRADELPDNMFIKHWSKACSMSSRYVLEELLFDSMDTKQCNPELYNINAFIRNIEKLNETMFDARTPFEITKLIAGYYLSTSKRLDIFHKILDGFGDNIETFEHDVFIVFCFNESDEQTFRDLDVIWGQPNYPIALYKKIFENAYGMQNEVNESCATLILESALIRCFDHVFIDNLSASLSRLQQ